MAITENRLDYKIYIKVLKEAAEKNLKEFNKTAIDGAEKTHQALVKASQQTLRDVNVSLDKGTQQVKVATDKQLEILKNGQIRAKSLITGRYIGLASVAQATQPLTQQNMLIQQNMTSLKQWSRTAEKTAVSLLFSYNSVGAALQQIGTTMTIGFTLPIVAAGAAAVKTFRDFEQGTIAIQRAAMITRGAADQITQNFRNIATQVPITVEELHRAGFAAAQAGLTGTKAITNFSRAIVELAKVGGPALRDLPVDDLADELAGLSIAFDAAGEDFEDITKVTSSFLAVADQVPGGLQDIVEALKRGSPAAAQLKIPLQDLTGILGTLVALRVPASRAGTQFNRALNKITIQVPKIAKALGQTTKEIKNRIDNDIMGLIIELIKRTEALGSEAERSAFLFEVFGAIGKKAFGPLVGNVEYLEENLRASNEAFDKGTLVARKFEIQANSLAGTMTTFASNVKELAASLGDDLAPVVSVALKGMTDGLKGAVDKWKEIPPLIKAAVFATLAFLAVVGPMALIIRNLFIVPLAVFFSLGGRILKVILDTKALLGVFKGGSSVIGGLGRIVGFLGFKLLILVGTIATFALAWKNNWFFIRDITLGVINTIGTALGGLAKLLGGFFKLLGVDVTSKRREVIKVPETAKPGAAAVSTASKTAAEETEKVTEEEVAATEEAFKATQKLLKDKRNQQKKTLRLLDRDIKETERGFDDELDVLKERVEQQEDVVEARRDAFEEERELADDEIKIRQRQLRDLRKAANEARDLLNDLRDTRNEEVESAKAVLELARLSLEASQNQLEKERILGRDEFDASFRAAEARVDSSEEQVELAGNTLVKTRRSFDKQIRIENAKVEVAQEGLDAHQEEIQVLRDALEDRRDLYEDEVDLLKDELKIRQDVLENAQKHREQTIELMRDERETIQRKFEDEIEILEARAEDAREARDKVKSAFDKINELPEEMEKVAGVWEELAKSGAGAIKAFGDAAKSINDAASLIPDVKVKPGSFLDKWGESILKILTPIFGFLALKKIGGLVGKLIPGMPIVGSTLKNIPKNLAKLGRSMPIIGKFFPKLAKTTKKVVPKIVKNLPKATKALTKGPKLPGVGASIFGATAILSGIQEISEAQKAGDPEQEMKKTFLGLGEAAAGGFFLGLKIGGPLGGLIGAAAGALIAMLFGLGPEELLTRLVENGKWLLDQIWTGMKNAWEASTEAVKDIGGNILKAIGEGLETALKTAILSNPLLLIIAFLVSEVIRYWPEITKIGSDILGKIGDGIVAVLAPIQTAGSAVINTFVKAVKAVLWLVKTVGTLIIDKVVAGLGGLWDKAFKIGKSVVTGIIGGIKNVIETVKTAAGDVWNKIKESPLGDMASAALQWGKDLINGLIKGIGETWEKVKEPFDAMVEYIKDSPLGKWYMKSPSRLFETYGSYLMEGLLKGITKKTREIYRTVDRIASQIASRFSRGLKTSASSIYSAVNTLVRIISKAFAPMVTTAFQIGVKVVSNLRRGITSLTGSIKAAGNFIANAVISGINKVVRDAPMLGRKISEKLGTGLRTTASIVTTGAKKSIVGVTSTLGALSGFATGWGRGISKALAKALPYSIWLIRRNVNVIAHVLKSLNIGRSAYYWGTGLISNLATGIWRGISSYLRGAVNSARNLLNKLNPWSKSSPSLVEQVDSGVTQMLKEYSRLSGLKIEAPTITPVTASVGTIRNLEGATAATATPGETRSVTYNIQPGTMIASKGEVRSFVRMLNDYQRIEEERLSSNEG